MKVFVGIAVIPGATRREAEDKRAEYLSHASAEAGLAHFSASTGIDFARYGLDEPIPYAPGNAIQSATAAAAQRGLTKRDLLAELGLGGRYSVVTGDAATVADELQSWVEEAEVDGFNLSRIVVPESFSDFIDLVIPELQDRGLYKTAYEPGTLRASCSERATACPTATPPRPIAAGLPGEGAHTQKGQPSGWPSTARS